MINFEKDLVRGTASKLVVGDPVDDNQRVTARVLVASGAVPPVYEVRCRTCKDLRVFYAEESDSKFERREPIGWRCASCNEDVASSEVVF